jgi:Domain of unknown function (DUF1906)
VLSFVRLRVLCGLFFASLPSAAPSQSYLGFDRNDYPGDENLQVLRQTFSYTGYWLNNPPGEKSNSWIGKRRTIESAGFGFLVLFNGRLYKQLKRNAAAVGQSDGQAAISAAKGEGFPAGTIVFLDIEEGGRMLPEQKAYIYAWVDAITQAGFRPGIYCSGIPANEGKSTIITAEDIRENAQGREITYWATNDACPPSPGCGFSAVRPSGSGLDFARIWQFAQSPRRKDFAAQCRNYDPDGNCYPPGVRPASHLHVDVNAATSPDPSRARDK